MDDEPKQGYWKFVAGFLAMIFVAVGGAVGWRVYEAEKRAEDAAKLVERLREQQEATYQRQLADTYGGKTPQETLRMYIDAVEKGDYELASKYFVVEKQEWELRSLRVSPVENINNVIRLLKLNMNSSGSSSGDGKRYIIQKPLLVDFIKYPSGIWKITEI